MTATVFQLARAMEAAMIIVCGRCGGQDVKCSPWTLHAAQGFENQGWTVQDGLPLCPTCAAGDAS